MAKSGEGKVSDNRLSDFPKNLQQRKEVTKMATKKSTCGCGCIPLKQNNKATKDEKKAKEAKKVSK